DANGCSNSANYTISVGSQTTIIGLKLVEQKNKTDVMTTTALCDGKLPAQAGGISQILIVGSSSVAANIASNATGTKVTFTNSAVPLNVGTNAVYATVFLPSGAFAYSPSNLVFYKVQKTIVIKNIGDGLGTITGKPLAV